MKNALRAKRFVVVLLVVEALVATKLVDVDEMKLANDEKRFVEDAVVAKKLVDVALVNTEDEATRFAMVAVVLLRVLIVPEADVRSLIVALVIVVVANVEFPVTTKVFVVVELVTVSPTIVARSEKKLAILPFRE